MTKVMQTIVRIGKANIINYDSNRRGVYYTAFLDCGHNVSFGKRVPKLKTTTRCEWCERSVTNSEMLKGI